MDEIKKSAGSGTLSPTSHAEPRHEKACQVDEPRGSSLKRAAFLRRHGNFWATCPFSSFQHFERIPQLEARSAPALRPGVELVLILGHWGQEWKPFGNMFFGHKFCWGMREKYWGDVWWPCLCHWYATAARFTQLDRAGWLLWLWFLTSAQTVLKSTCSLPETHISWVELKRLPSLVKWPLT